MLRPLSALALLPLLVACSRSPKTGPGSAQVNTRAAETPSAPATATATANGLTLTWEITPDLAPGRIPLRTAKLRFRNTSTKPIRIAFPQAEPFRSQISDLSFTSPTNTRFFAPEPHPHGYVITEIDFPEIAPGEEKVFTQTFTLDPFGRGGAGPARRPGFEKGTPVSITWTYQNHGTSRPGGQQTLDGVTKPLFGGGPIPGIWTGKIEAKGTWTVPD